MLHTMALLVALGLAPGQAGELTVTNIRSTYGLLGSTRLDNKLLPGDRFFAVFDIENIKVDENGRVLYSMGMDVSDSKGKSLYKQDPRELEGLNSLGGARLPCFAHVDVGLDQPPGEYTVKVTVTDRAAKKSASFERKFEVLPLSFGLVGLNATSDPKGEVPAPPLGVAGQSIWLNFAAVGFAAGGAKNEPNVSIVMRVYDEDGKPTLPKGFAGEFTELPKDVKAVPMQFLLALNRPGKFKVKLEATDLIAKKKAELSFPITVVDVK